jgi:hypothetical protein
MKSLMRNLTLSAAALAVLVVAAPQSNADQFRRGEARQTIRGNPGHGGTFRGQTFRGGESRGREFRGGPFRGNEFRGREFRGREFRGGDFRGGREFRGNEFRGRAFARPPAFFSGRGRIAPFRFFAGSRFFSYCPGPDYIYIDDLGWVFPPFVGALWVPRFDPFGVRIGGFWQ